MALPVVDGVLRKIDKFLFNETTVGIVRTFESYSGLPPTISELLALGTLLGTGFTADLAPVMSPNVSYASSELTDLSSDTGAQVTTDYTGLDGTEAGGILPAAAAFMINGQISRRYRGGKQKSFVPFGTDADLLTDQTWETASADGFIDAWLTFQSIIPDNAWSGAGVVAQCNVSYYDGFTAVENPLTGRYRNVPKLRATPLVDILVGFDFSIEPRFIKRRGLL